MNYEDQIWNLNTNKLSLMDNVAERIKREASVIGYEADRKIKELKKRIAELEG